MASLAHLSREERLGLGVAVVAHVALVAALVVQVGDTPTPLPIPERIEVSLADDVALTATAPDPVPESAAAVAPVLAERPAPAPAPVPVQTTAPRQPIQSPRQSATRPTPAPSARPAPATPARPAAQPPQTRAGGSRIGADFLPAEGASERSDAAGTPGATFGPAEQAALVQAISRQLKPHWSAPQGVDAERLVTVLSWELNSDGSLKGRPTVVSQSGINDSNRPQAQLHAERAIRAVQLAAPFRLPDEYYDRWRRIRSFRFDRSI